jgi:hypothetical protein
MTVLYAGLLMVLVVVGIAIGPAPDWWSIYLPEPAAAAFRLREAKFVAFHTGCRWQDVEDWRQIRKQPSAATWFGAVIDDRETVASAIYGLVGLREVDSQAFAARLNSIWPVIAEDTVLVVDTGAYGPVPVASLLPRLRSGRLARLFSHDDQRPEC